VRRESMTVRGAAVTVRRESVTVRGAAVTVRRESMTTNRLFRSLREPLYAAPTRPVRRHSLIGFP